MTGPDPDATARRLAQESLSVDDPTGWFERLYRAAAHGEAIVPWDRGTPHPLLAQWVESRGLDGAGRRALIVGCGPGWDAEHIASLGFATVAFDISAAAIEEVRRRFPHSPVRYVTADLLAPPAKWRGAFDLVVESLTVQSMPDPPRAAAIRQVGDLVAPGGTLVVVATAYDESFPIEPPPWPLTRAEVQAFATCDLRPVRIEQVRDPARPSAARWCAEFHRTPLPS